MKEKEKNIKVAIVDDDEDFRGSLSWLIQDTKGYTCTGAYRNCQEAIKGISHETPDVILMDIGMPGESGIKCVEHIKQDYPDIPIVMQTVYSDEDKIFESLRAGAVGYLLKKTPTQKLFLAIEDAYEGGAPMSGEIARRVLQFFQRPKRQSLESLLTDREIDVLNQLIKGHSYIAISEILFITVNTVRHHVRNIYHKLHVTSRSEAVAKVLNNKMM